MTTSRKDELLAHIAKLTEAQVALHTKRESEVSKAKEVKARRDVVQKAYDELKVQLDSVKADYFQYEQSIKDIDRIGNSNKYQLESAQRELNRLLDAEKIHRAYIDSLDEFRNSCLSATWRPENREDGIGAFEHQIEGAIHLAVAKQALLGDQRGLGKTLTALIWMDLLEINKAIVVCPPDTMDNFIREVHMWAPHRNIVKVGGMDKGQRDFILPALKNVPQYIVVINYQAWRRDSQLIDDLIALNAEALIEDEAHHAKNMDTTTCRGIVDLRFGINKCDGCGNPRFDKNNTTLRAEYEISCDCGHSAPITDFCSIKYVLPMTGTPILNRPQELFPHLHLIDPGNFRTLNNFLRDFCVQYSNMHWGWRHGAEKTLIEKLGHRYIARDRGSTGVKVPPCRPITHLITMKELEERYPKQYKAYMQTRNYAQLVLDPDNDIAMSMTVKITVLLRLRQVLTWPAAIQLKINEKVGESVEGYPIFEEKVLANLDVHESIKLDKAEEIIREANEEGFRVVLFSQFKAPLHELQRRLGSNTAVYDGSTSSHQRNAIQIDFDAKTMPSEPRWMNVLCNYKAAAEGLNFTGASQMVILDEEWNPGKQEQAYGRIDRIGQTKETQIHTIRVDQSVDKWMADLIDEKKDIIDGFEGEADMYQRAYDALKRGEL